MADWCFFDVVDSFGRYSVKPIFTILKDVEIAICGNKRRCTAVWDNASIGKLEFGSFILVIDNTILIDQTASTFLALR